MKMEFQEYLAAINMPEALKARIETLLSYIAELCPEDISELFVSEYIEEDGTRRYESVFFFSPSYVMEAKQFLTEIDLDIATMSQSIYYFSVESQAYPLKNATEQSRVYIKCRLRAGSPSLSFELKGSKENCDFAMRLVQTVIRPNLMRGTHV